MIRDIRAALVTATLSLAYSLSTSALIFAGPLQKFLGLGMAAALMTTTITATVTSLGSGFRIAIANPTSTIAAALAVTISLLNPILEKLSDARAVALVFAALGLMSMAAGGALVLIGIGRLGRIVRFVPFPVVAGFMATTGWLLAAGAIHMTTQLPVRLATLPSLAASPKSLEVGIMFLWAAILAIATNRFKSPATLPCLLIGAVVLIDGGLAISGVSRETPFMRDLMFRADSHLAIELPFFSSTVYAMDWAPLLSLVPNMLALIFITVLTVLLTCSGLESALDVDGDLDRELKIQGAANILSGLAGGYVGLISVGSTMAGRAAGARSRAVGLITGLICLGALLGGMTIVNDVPRFIVGGLQFQLGATVVWTWCIGSWRKMPLAEWLLVIGIVGIAVWFGFVPAILSGVLGGCILFAMDVSRINVIRRVYGVNERGSALVRSAEEIAAIAKNGMSAKVVELNGYIFFGSAYQLLTCVKTLLDAGGLRILVLDFTAVSGGDSSAAAVLGRLNKLLARSAVRLVFAGVKPDVKALLENSDAIDPGTTILATRDAALQLAEGNVLSETGTPAPTTIPLKTWLSRALGRSDYAEALIPWLECADVSAGTYLCRQGEPTDTLLFIETGRVGVMIGSGQTEVSVRVFGPHTIAGEQGFILKQPRSASLKVEQDARVWSLPRGAYDQLVTTNADLVIALMRDIVRVQSERLTFATRQAATLA